MQPRPLLVVLAAVFAGLSVVLTVAAAVTATPLVLMAAVPMAITGLLMWYQGTGRLKPGVFSQRRRTRRRSTRTPFGGGSRVTARQGRNRREGSRGTTFREEANREARYRARRQARNEATVGDGSGTSGARANRRERADRYDGLTRAEAYDVLGLDPSASEDDVRAAYREKAKTAHPDTDGGSAESFQDLNDAYERLIDD